MQPETLIEHAARAPADPNLMLFVSCALAIGCVVWAFWRAGRV